MFRLPPPKYKHQRSLARIPAAARPVWLCANARKYTKYFLCFALRHPLLSPAVLRTTLHRYLHSLWTPLTPQRTRGCSPLVTPKRRSSGKNRAVCPAAQTLFRFFPSSDLECCARFCQRGHVFQSLVNGMKQLAYNQQTFCLCQSLSLSGEVARRSRDGEGKRYVKQFKLFGYSKTFPCSLTREGFFIACVYCSMD